MVVGLPGFGEREDSLRFRFRRTKQKKKPRRRAVPTIPPMTIPAVAPWSIDEGTGVPVGNSG